MTEKTFTPVAKRADVATGSTLTVDHGGQSILICNSNDEIFAIENKCSHAEEPLACGRIRNGWIACPVHGARFDLETGDPINPPATLPIRTFPVRIVDDMIEIAV